MPTQRDADMPTLRVAEQTMQLLAGRLVELNVVGSISGDCVHRTLKKMSSSPT